MIIYLQKNIIIRQTNVLGIVTLLSISSGMYVYMTYIHTSTDFNNLINIYTITRVKML